MPRPRTASPSPADLAVPDPATWVDRHGDLLFRYALARVRDPSIAEDLVQETLLAALRNRERFTGRSSESTWLVGILRHKIVDHHRAEGRRAEDAETAPDELFDEKGKWRREPAAWPSALRSPEERSEFRAALDRCASLLPPGLAEVYALRGLEQLDAASICDVLGISPTNLWTRLHRMRMMLRECLERRWLGRDSAKGEAGL